jgi:glycosyltransferase involved in cell wall biosynthesis
MDETFSAMCAEDIREYLCLTGYLNDEELRALYSSCRAFIYPSLYEGFGLPPLEAMACGAPVIASRIAALEETIGDAAILVEPLDAGVLAGRIITLLEDGRRRDELVAKGRATIRRFSWEKAARATHEVYSKALT